MSEPISHIIPNYEFDQCDTKKNMKCTTYQSIKSQAESIMASVIWSKMRWNRKTYAKRTLEWDDRSLSRGATTTVMSAGSRNEGQGNELYRKMFWVLLTFMLHNKEVQNKKGYDIDGKLHWKYIAVTEEDEDAHSIQMPH